MKKALYLLLIFALCAQLFGCSATGGASRSRNLMAEITPAPVTQLAQDPVCAEALADFSVQLLQNSLTDGETAVLSPYSVLCALAMTANGASGETAEEFEALFGLPIEQLNAWLHTCAAQSGDALVSANALWINEATGEISQDFLQTNADYYGADVYQSVFDSSTVKEINGWVAEQTNGRISALLDRLDANAALLLLNALTFDAKWASPYEPAHVGIFQAADGTQEQAQMLSSTESLYLDDGRATGFVKPYAGRQYSFAVLLPNEDVSLEDYIASVTGAGLLATISGAAQEQVLATMPALELSTALDLSRMLQSMGLVSAFGGSADFSAMGAGDLSISTVQHQTSLIVDTEGTQAAAATAVTMTEKAALETRSVYVNRPYLFVILDNTTQTIVFLGAVNSIA